MNGLFAGARRYPGLFGDPDPRAVTPQIAAGVRQPAGTMTTQPVATPTPPAAPQSRVQQILAGLGNGVGQAFAGADDPNLTAEQNERARNSALIRAGLGMLSMSGSGASFGQQLAGGAMAGQEAGAGERERLYLSTQEERLERALNDPTVVGKLDPNQLAMIRLLPPTEAVKMLTGLAFREAPNPVVVGKGSVLVGPDGKPIYQNPDAPAGPNLPANLEAVLWASGVDPAQMTAEQREAALSQWTDLEAEQRRAGATTVNVQTPGEQLADTNSLGTQFRQDIAEFQQIARSYGRVLASTQNPSPAGDMSLVFAYMKMLDPTSAVREGEQASAQNAGSIPERVWAAYNRARNGQRFTDTQRTDFVSRARQLATQSQREVQPILRRYRSRASEGGVEAGNIVFDPFEEVGMSDPFGDL